MAEALFLHIAGVPSDGMSKIQSHENHIPIRSWSWTLDQRMSKRAKSSGGVLSVGDLVVIKDVDHTSPSIQRKCLSPDEKGVTCTLWSCIPVGENKWKDVVKITMNGCIISHITTGGSIEQDRGQETIKINFADINYECPDKNVSSKWADWATS